MTALDMTSIILTSTAVKILRACSMVFLNMPTATSMASTDAEQPSSSSVHSMKAALRASIAAVKLSSKEIARQSRAVANQVLERPELASSSRVSIYCSMPDEVQTDAIIQALFRAGKHVFVPRFISKQAMQMVRLRDLDHYRQLPTYKWGIRQPATEETLEEALGTGGLDLILLPGVAFTVDGKRLGHGRGYYDKFLAQHYQIHGRYPSLIGLALKHQVVERVPVTEHDVRLHDVIYDRT